MVGVAVTGALMVGVAVMVEATAALEAAKCIPHR
jgi:hypothetical protein